MPHRIAIKLPPPWPGTQSSPGATFDNDPRPLMAAEQPPVTCGKKGKDHDDKTRESAGDFLLALQLVSFANGLRAILMRGPEGVPVTKRAPGWDRTS
jgi:hypothetical protein